MKPTNCGMMNQRLSSWESTISVSDSEPGHHHHADERQALGDLVGDQLRRRAHRAEEGVLAARRPAAEHQPVEGEAAERERVQDADARVDPVEADLRPEDVVRVRERDQRHRRHGREHRDRGREREHPADRAVGPELLLEQQLPDVGHRLQRAERADAVRAVAVLEAAEDLALGEQHDRHELEDHREDDQRLQDLDPPGLVVADLGEDRHAAPRRPAGGSSAGCRAGRSAAPRPRPRPRASPPRRWPAPAGRAADAPHRDERLGQRVRGLVVRALDEEHRAAGHRGAQPRGAAHARAVGADLDLSPSRTPRRSASTGESSTTWRGRMKCSAGRGRPRARPRASARCRGAARRRPPPRRRAGRERDRLPRRRGQRRGRLGGRPAHAAPADLVERQPGVEGDGVEELLRGHRPGEHAEVVPGAPCDLRDTCQPARTPASSRPGRPIAGRSRWTRPSGCTSVPSFSA